MSNLNRMKKEMHTILEKFKRISILVHDSKIGIEKLELKLRESGTLEKEKARYRTSISRKSQELSTTIIEIEAMQIELLKYQDDFPEIVHYVGNIISQNDETSEDTNWMEKIKQHALNNKIPITSNQWGDFQKKEKLHDGINKVYLMNHKLSNEFIVLKCVDIGNEDEYHSIVNELVNIMRLSPHDRIVKLRGIFCDTKKSEVFIEMPYYPNGTIKQYMKKLKDQVTNHEHRMNAREKLRTLMRTLIETLQYIHSKKIIHRDLKSGNILIDQNGNIVLTDFGSSKKLLANLTNTCTLGVGTDAYLDPEVKRRERAPNERSDVWSVGVIMLECWSILEGIETSGNGGEILSYVSENKVKLPTPKQDDHQGKYLMELLDHIFNTKYEMRPLALELLIREDYFTKGGEMVTELIHDQGMKIKMAEESVQHWINTLTQIKHLVLRESEVGCYFSICIHRNSLVAETCKELMDSYILGKDHITARELYLKMEVRFKDESGIDQGALTNELFTQFFHQCLQNPRLFKRSDSNGIENYILSNNSITLEEKNILTVFGYLLKKVLLDCDDKSIYLPLNDFVLQNLICKPDIVTICLLNKTPKEQLRYWTRFVQQYDSNYCENVLRCKDYQTNDELQLVLCEETFNDPLHYTAHDASIKFKTIPLTIDHIDHYIICKFRDLLFSNDQQEKMKLIFDGFNIFKLSNLIPYMVEKERDWFREEHLTLNELKLLLNGQSYIDSSLLMNQMDFTQLERVSPTVSLHFTNCVSQLSKIELRKLLIWMTSLSSIPLRGLPKKIKLRPSTKFASHACTTVLSFEVWLENDFDIFRNQFMRMLNLSSESTQEE